MATTSVIRAKIGMNKNQGAGASRAVVEGDSEEKAALRTLFYPRFYPDAVHDPNWHFLSHAFRAFEALGLSWNKVNNFKVKGEF